MTGAWNPIHCHKYCWEGDPSWPGVSAGQRWGQQEGPLALPPAVSPRTSHLTFLLQLPPPPSTAPVSGRPDTSELMCLMRQRVSGPQKAVQTHTVALSTCRSRLCASGLPPGPWTSCSSGMCMGKQGRFHCSYLRVHFHVLTLGGSVYRPPPPESAKCVSPSHGRGQWGLDPEVQAPPPPPSPPWGQVSGGKARRGPPEGSERCLG